METVRLDLSRHWTCCDIGSIFTHIHTGIHTGISEIESDIGGWWCLVNGERFAGDVLLVTTTISDIDIQLVWAIRQREGAYPPRGIVDY